MMTFTQASAAIEAERDAALRQALKARKAAPPDDAEAPARYRDALTAAWNLRAARLGALADTFIRAWHAADARADYCPWDGNHG